jgi:hypothetical protein
MAHLDRQQLEEAVKDFKLKKLEPGEHVLTEDCILLRGACVVINNQEKQEEAIGKI